MNFELRRLATSKGPDENRFNQLANSVENFTFHLLDPLKCDQRRREEFGDDLDGILEDAIYLQQKRCCDKESRMTQVVFCLLFYYVSTFVFRSFLRIQL